jgi:flagellar protein FlaI
VNEIFQWNASNDTFESKNPSMVLRKITQQYGIGEGYLQKELANRSKIISWMLDNGVEDYIDVSRVIKLYYSDPQNVLSSI